ncbi:protein of unknown function [Cupriavidus taiwanensis]|nr:protein of unknown function [Cupriavidus taiwanensis]
MVVQSVRIPACHAGGRGFESRPLRQYQETPASRAFFICAMASLRHVRHPAQRALAHRLLIESRSLSFVPIHYPNPHA